MRVVVSGSSGTIGTALCRALAGEGHDVVRLVRRASGGPGEASWDPASGTLDPAVLAGAGAVVNLNGVSLGAKRWTEEQKQAILESRTASTGTLARAIAAADPAPRVFVSQSAVGYYGSFAGGETEAALDEDAPPGDDFLSRVCVAWEAATTPARDAGVRTVCLRSGVVLTTEGPPLTRMLLPFKLGLGGRIGSGRQWMSWIALDDTLGVIRRVIDDGSFDGPVNSCAPEPVRQREFAATLARVLRRPAILPTPVFALKAVYGGELVRHLLVEGQRVVPARLERAGFEFTHPDLEGALRAMLGR
jgi:uncharacterized protein (TIGR01777 family)